MEPRKNSIMIQNKPLLDLICDTFICKNKLIARPTAKFYEPISSGLFTIVIVLIKICKKLSI